MFDLFTVVVSLLLLVSESTTQIIQHSSGVIKPTNVAQAVKSYTYVKDPMNGMTLCAKDTHSQVIQGVTAHGECMKACFNNATCVSYNYHYNTSTCDLFNNVSLMYVHDKLCINYKDNSVTPTCPILIETSVKCFLLPPVHESICQDVGISFDGTTSITLLGTATADLEIFLTTDQGWTSSYYYINFGQASNTYTVIGYPSINTHVASTSTPNILIGSLQWFWASWANGVIQAGKGSLVGQNVIVSYSPNNLIINRMCLSSYGYQTFFMIPSNYYNSSGTFNYTWAYTPAMHSLIGQQNSAANTIDGCKQLCIAIPTCTGLDFCFPTSGCWLDFASTTGQLSSASDNDHYDIIRTPTSQPGLTNYQVPCGCGN